jgi:Spy/CpxP family protein refolding chaperone
MWLPLGALLVAPSLVPAPSRGVLTGAVAAASPQAPTSALPPKTTSTGREGRSAQTQTPVAGQAAAATARPGTPGLFPPWEWWKDEDVKKQLGLSEDKARKIDSIFQRRFGQMKPVADEFQREWEKLDRMTRERVADEMTYGLQVQHVENIYSRIRESRTIMLYAMYLELQPEQYKKLVDIRERHNREARGGRSSNKF